MIKDKAFTNDFLNAPLALGHVRKSNETMLGTSHDVLIDATVDYLCRLGSSFARRSRGLLKVSDSIPDIYRVDHMFGNAVKRLIVSQLIDGGNFF